jgi:hypothetical protein
MPREPQYPYRDPESRKKRVYIKLDSTGYILKEMARVYREMRAGIIDSQDGSRLVAALAIMRQTREFQLVEENMIRMQEQLDQLQSNSNKPMLKVLK